MKFRKQILKEGLYVTGDGKGGRRPEFISSNRIKHWADQHREMKNAGILVPAPDYHEKEAKPEMKSDPKRWSASKNGSKSNFGFWDEMTVTSDQDGTSVLEGVLEAPQAEDAEKIGKTVRETSIFTLPEFVDGTGKVWKDVISHVAVVTQPIEPGQKNFEPEENQLSMSHHIQMNVDDMRELMDDDDTNPADLCDMLEKVAGLAVPKGTPTEKLPEVLLLALKQKQLSDQDKMSGGSLDKPPKDSQLHQVPVVMSNNQVANEPEVQAAETQPTVEMSMQQTQIEGLKSALSNAKQKELQTRLANIKNLVSEDDFNRLAEEVGSVQMSFDNQGAEIKSGLEYKLEALEAVKVPMPSNKPTMEMAVQGENGKFVIQPNPTPETESTQMTGDDADAIVNQLFATGFTE